MGSKIKVAQNGLKHILVLEFLISDEIWKIEFFFVTVHTQTDNQSTR